MKSTGNSRDTQVNRRQSTMMSKMSILQSSLAQSMCSIDLTDSNWTQDLPCLPVPDLKITLDRYLSSLKPVISEEQYNRTLAIVRDFMRREGPQLQRDLKEYANKCQNWATDFWLDDMYLSNPLPLPINSNPLFLFPKQKFRTSDDMLMFATRIIQFSVDFKNRIDRQTLSQDYGSGHGKGKPLCMETYKNFFHSCRIPHEDKDRLLRQSRRSNHIVVASCNQFFILRLGQDPLDNPYRNDLPPLDETCIFNQLSRIYRVSRQRAARNLRSDLRPDSDDKQSNSGEYLDKRHEQSSTIAAGAKIPKIGLLTTENRKLWAKIHKQLCRDEVNLKSISQIEDCLFVMCLDSLVSIDDDSNAGADGKNKVADANTNSIKAVNGGNINVAANNHLEGVTNKDKTGNNMSGDDDDEEQLKMAVTILTGGGCDKFSANRWFDKFLQVIVGRDGVCGINIEHSASEGITVLRFLEEFPEYLDRLTPTSTTTNNNTSNSNNSDQQQLRQHPSSVGGNKFDFSSSALFPAVSTSYANDAGTTTTTANDDNAAGAPVTNSSAVSPSLIASPAALSPSSMMLINDDDNIIPIEWRLDEDILAIIQEAQCKMDKLIDNFDLKILKFTQFGKTFIKQQNVSPDAFVQLALQLTYYKLHNKLVSTYESASLRQFRLGRVDNIRANSSEVLQWVKSMVDWKKQTATALVSDTNATTYELFQVAIKRQVEILRYTITGGGPDNHLLALRELAKIRYDDQLPQLYEDDSYKEYLKFKLSTSQLPSERGIIVGYGAVVPDGYGCSYNPCENYIIFCVSSFVDCSETSSAKFADSLYNSLNDMKQLLLLSATKD